MLPPGDNDEVELILVTSCVCVCLGYCAAEFGSSGGTYELPCILIFSHCFIF